MSLQPNALVLICGCKGTTFSRTTKTFWGKIIKKTNFFCFILHFARFAVPLYPVTHILI